VFLWKGMKLNGNVRKAMKTGIVPRYL
jgi:hypothetical protein